jgi:hypothetical protein
VSDRAMWSSGWASCFPTFTGRCTGSTRPGTLVAIELSIRGTFLGLFETRAGVIQPTGVKLDIPTADFWYVRDGGFVVAAGIALLATRIRIGTSTPPAEE